MRSEGREVRGQAEDSVTEGLMDRQNMLLT